MKLAAIARCVVLVGACSVMGCGIDPIADTDEVFYSWDGRRSLCGVSIDTNFDLPLERFREALVRARVEGEVLIAYGHKIGGAIPMDRLEAILRIAVEEGVPFLTFPELHGSAPDTRAGFAITFDDAYIDAWHSALPLFREYDARVTFFVTRAHQLTDARLGKLTELYMDGHAVESHGFDHFHAPDFVEEFGVDAYVKEQVLPSLEVMRELGFAPTTFAYPFGARTGELDDAVLQTGEIELVRSISWMNRIPLLHDPCGG